jgi:hypothetical protein
MRRAFGLFLLLFLAGCANSGKGFSETGDGDDASAAPPPPPVRDGGADAEAGACTLGTPDHCGKCDTSCPGTDDAHTQRTCSDATPFGICGITCKGEFYDLDGSDANGCEAEDATVQDTEATAVAVSLPDANPKNIDGQMYGDGRPHDAAPVSRPFGRDDYYKVTATGTGSPSNTMTACLSITNFPADNTFEVCIKADGAASFAPASCKSVNPQSQSADRCVTPPGNPDIGTFFVRVRKTAGSNTANKYALYLVH